MQIFHPGGGFIRWMILMLICTAVGYFWLIAVSHE